MGHERYCLICGQRVELHERRIEEYDKDGSNKITHTNIKPVDSSVASHHSTAAPER